VLFNFEAHDLISTHRPTRSSLYLLWRTPPQKDAATIGANKECFGLIIGFE
jgi:hypothetical protein